MIINERSLILWVMKAEQAIARDSRAEARALVSEIDAAPRHERDWTPAESVRDAAMALAIGFGSDCRDRARAHLDDAAAGAHLVAGVA